MGWKLSVFAILLCSLSIQAKAELWNIVVDEWPPYSCSKCPEGGAGVKALKEALRTVNVDVEVTYLPWVHVLREVRTQKYLGYMSWSASVKKGYLLPTQAVFESKLIFVENATHPLEWNVLSDLKGKRIGLHEGSGYFDELMDLVNRKIIVAVMNPSDSARILLVSQGKLDGALLEQENAKYYLEQMPERFRNKIKINEHILKIEGTYLVISERNRDKVVTLEKALKNVNTQKIVDDYIKKLQSIEKPAIEKPY